MPPCGPGAYRRELRIRRRERAEIARLQLKSFHDPLGEQARLDAAARAQAGTDGRYWACGPWVAGELEARIARARREAATRDEAVRRVLRARIVALVQDRLGGRAGLLEWAPDSGALLDRLAAEAFRRLGEPPYDPDAAIEAALAALRGSRDEPSEGTRERTK